MSESEGSKQIRASLSRSLRVLWIVHYPVFGGPHNRILRLHRALAATGVDVTVVLPNEPGTAAVRLREAGVRTVQGPLHRFRATAIPSVHLRAVRAFRHEVGGLRGYLRRGQFDLVLIGGLVNPHGALAGHLEGVGVVWQIIDSRTPRPLTAVMLPLVERLADLIMFGGESLVAFHFGRRRPRIPFEVAAPPVDTDRFFPSTERREAARADCGIPANAPVVGTVANINPQKGIEYFVSAAARIAARVPDAWFLVIGERYETQQAYTRAIEHQVRATRLNRRLLFLGGKSDVERYYPAMDVKLITSIPRSEGTTTTALEAMACGVPVVATDVGAVADVVQHAATGLVVPALDDSALAEATVALLNDPQQRAAFGDAGRRRAVERYSIPVAVRLQLQAFERAIRHRRQRHGAASGGVP